jgi:tetratricopeptide (TPR) repeat protein
MIAGIVFSAVAFAQSAQWEIFTAASSRGASEAPSSRPDPFDWKSPAFTIRTDSTPVHGGFVSMHVLKIPPKALAAFQESLRLSAEGRRAKAIEKLRTALRIHPDFWEAHANLGTYLYMSNDVEGAVAAYQKALEVGPESALLQTNLAAALLSMHLEADAEKVARRALALDPKYAKARYIYGRILTVLHREAEAIPHLELAAKEIPSAETLLHYLSSSLQPR